jgi:hypothetical protein
VTTDIPGVQLQQNDPVERRRDPRYWCFGLDGKWRPNRRFDTRRRDRRIVELRVVNRQSIRAIATEMDCSAGTVHRVLKLWGAA